MTDPALDTAATAELHELLLSAEGIDELLQQLAGLAAREVAAGLSCGITLRPNGRLFTVASSDALASRLDEVQYGLDDGPCLQSLDRGEPVHIPDMADGPGWTGFRARALADGVKCSLSLPLRVGDHAAGALNLYSATTHAFDDEAMTRGQAFADEAARAMALAMRFTQQAQLTDHLRTALGSRAVIDQAIGILMAQNRCDSDEAFAMLRSASQHRNVKLREVATDIVTSVTGKPPRSAPPFQSPR